MEERIIRLEAEFDELQHSIARVEMLRENCPLDPYKEEMRERCQRFSDKITDNKELTTTFKNLLEKELVAVEKRCTDRIKTNRTIIGRLISTSLLIGVCLVGIIGTIQINKVDVHEYMGHLDAYRADRLDEREAFNKFLDSYTFDRQKRDDKIDKLFNEQRTFNVGIMKQNSLLEQQLEVIKVKLNVE